MKGQRDGGHFLGAVLKHDDRLLVDAARCKTRHRDDFLRVFREEKTCAGQSVDADVEECAARETEIEEAVFHIVRLITAEAQLRETKRAELARLDARGERTIERHVVDRHRLSEDESLLLGERGRRRKLVRIERDGLFREYMLAGGERLHDVGRMRIVRRRDVDDVNVRVGEESRRRIVRFFYAELCREVPHLLRRAPRCSAEAASEPLQRLRHFMRDRAAADRRPAAGSLLFHNVHSFKRAFPASVQSIVRAACR